MMGYFARVTEGAGGFPVSLVLYPGKSRGTPHHRAITVMSFLDPEEAVVSSVNEPDLIRISYEDLQGKKHVQVHELFHSPALKSLPTVRSDDYVERPETGDWSMLAGLADQWFHAHMRLSMPGMNTNGLLSPFVFSAGHAVELYLKAVVAANESLDVAIELGHRLTKLWERCEVYDQFPFKGLLRPELLDRDRDIYSSAKRGQLSQEIRQHLGENELLYLALRHVQDLKYLGTPGKTLRNGFKLSFGSPVPNKVMINQLGRMAHWVWGQWACKPGYNNASLYEQANELLR